MEEEEEDVSQQRSPVDIGKCYIDLNIECLIILECIFCVTKRNIEQ